MTGSTKHAKTVTPSDADLKRNPGIGQSPGTEKFGPDSILGDNTVEGDVENDVNAEGGMVESQRGRTNK